MNTPSEQPAGSREHLLPADYALPVDGEFAAAERHRTASSGAVWSCAVVLLHERRIAYGAFGEVAGSCPRAGTQKMGTNGGRWPGHQAGPAFIRSISSCAARRSSNSPATATPGTDQDRPAKRCHAPHPSTPAICQPPDGPAFRSTHIRRPCVAGQKLQLATLKTLSQFLEIYC
jgi:hypothetical protein